MGDSKNMPKIAAQQLLLPYTSCEISHSISFNMDCTNFVNGIKLQRVSELDPHHHHHQQTS